MENFQASYLKTKSQMGGEQMQTRAKRLMTFLMMLGSAFGCMAQDKLRTIEQPAKFTYPDTPIGVELKIDGKEMPDRKVKAGPDWIRRISLEVTNTSGKDINSLWINLVLREPVLGAREATPETAGIVITVELRHTNIKLLEAGQHITLKPPVAMVDYWTKYAREQGMDDIERVILDIRQVGFTDDTVWTRGRISRKDPKTGRLMFAGKNRVYIDSILIPDSIRFFF
jgi:hypothetical protein